MSLDSKWLFFVINCKRAIIKATFSTMQFKMLKVKVLIILKLYITVPSNISQLKKKVLKTSIN
jgi:hypothetical protein